MTIRQQQRLAAHKEFERRYFLASGHYGTRQNNIKAFKILRVLEDSCNFAICLALVHTITKNPNNVQHGILTMPLDLWSILK